MRMNESENLSEWLYLNPFQSPLVPGLNELEGYMTRSETSEAERPGMERQIGVETDCQRALDWVRTHRRWSTVMPEFRLDELVDRSTVDHWQVTTTGSPDSIQAPALGDVYRSRVGFQVWDGSRLCAGANFRPMLALIVQAQEDEEGRPLCEVIPCSIAESLEDAALVASDLDLLSSDGTTLVAHPDLRCWMDREQLEESRVDSLDSISLEFFDRCQRHGRVLSSTADRESRARRQLRERATILNAGPESRSRALAFRESVIRVVEVDFQRETILDQIQDLGDLRSAAASGTYDLSGLIWPNGVEAVLAQKEHALAEVVESAQAKGFVVEQVGESWCWELEATETLTGGESFLLVNLTSGAVVWQGNLSRIQDLGRFYVTPPRLIESSLGRPLGEGGSEPLKYCLLVIAAN